MAFANIVISAFTESLNETMAVGQFVKGIDTPIGPRL